MILFVAGLRLNAPRTPKTEQFHTIGNIIFKIIYKLEKCVCFLKIIDVIN